MNLQAVENVIGKEFRKSRNVNVQQFSGLVKQLIALLAIIYEERFCQARFFE